MEDYRLDQSGQEVQDILNGAAMQVDLTAETERATEAEQTLQGNIDAEATRAQGAEGTLQDNIDAEEARAKAAEKKNADDIDAIEEKIPSGASSSNKLATEEYVNDSVATATATFRGTYNVVTDLGLTISATHAQIATALAGAILTADNNDYAFVLIPTSAETPLEIASIERYKFNGAAWGFEYVLNNSGFTAAQWAAINSGITSGDVAKLAALPTNAQLTTLLAGLQSDIDGEATRAQGAEGTLQDNIDAEKTRAKAAEKQNADDIDAIEEKIPSVASSSNKLATESEINSLSAAIEAILLLIPSAATSLNKLADKEFVNSSISTATATFRGTYNLVGDLGLTISATHAQIATALAGAILTADNNDYAFVQIPTSDAMPTEIAKTERYKFNGTAWEYEYDLNNSGFTAAQWAAINSGITQALKAKLSDLPTNAELTTELGTLTSGITAINQKIPNAASQANKLVDTAAMESYIVQVLDVLTISYNVTSTDGHITVQISQVDGKITSVAVSTSDIASAADLNLKASQADLTALASRVTTAEGNITSLGGRMTTAEGNITSLGGRVSTNETDIEDLKAAYAGLTQSDIIIGALPASGVANKIYRVPGTNSYSDYMWNGTQFVLMATYNNAIDPRPKKASQNLVTSGGVFDNMGALDVSELNATENPHTLAQYVDLSAALAAIPTDYQKGGMSIKFVQSSDNKYVQWRYMGTAVTGNPNPFLDTANWQGLDDVDIYRIIGNGTNYSSIQYKGLIPRHTYKITFKNEKWSRTQIPSDASKWLFGIRNHNNNIYETLVSVPTTENNVDKEYTFVARDNDFIEIGLRADTGVNVNFELFDESNVLSYSPISVEWVNGSYSDNPPALTVVSNRLRTTDFIWMNKGSYIQITATDEQRVGIVRWLPNSQFRVYPDVIFAENGTFYADEDYNVLPVILNKDNSDISIETKTSDASFVLAESYEKSIKTSIKTLSSDINDLQIKQQEFGLRIDGDNNKYVSIKEYGLREGRIYKVVFKDENWARTQVPSATTYLFAIRSCVSDVFTNIMYVETSTPHTKHEYFFLCPENDYIEFGGRADKGTPIEFELIDYTNFIVSVPVSIDWVNGIWSQDGNEVNLTNVSNRLRASDFIKLNANSLIEISASDTQRVAISGWSPDFQTRLYNSKLFTNNSLFMVEQDCWILPVILNKDNSDISVETKTSEVLVNDNQYYKNVIAEQEIETRAKKEHIEEVELYIGNLVNSDSSGGQIVSNEQWDTLRVITECCCALPDDNITLHFEMPDGYYCYLWVGTSDGNIPTKTVTDLGWFENGSTFQTGTYKAYRVVFAKGATKLDEVSAFEIQKLIDYGKIRIWYQTIQLDIVERNSDKMPTISSLGRVLVDELANNKMWTMPIFAHISDIHGDYQRLKNALEFCDKFGRTIGLLVTGDVNMYYRRDKTSFMYQNAIKHNTDVYYCIGNHEAHPTGSNNLFNEHLVDMANKYGYTSNGTDITTNCYWYKDFATEKIRLIALNYYEEGIYNGYLGQSQISWFVGVLSSTPANYGVLIILHSPEDKVVVDSPYDKFRQQHRVVEWEENGFYVGNRPIMHIVDAFIGKTTYSDSYTESNGDVVSINCDFTQREDTAEFIAYACGHRHEDWIGYYEHSTNKQLCLDITCAIALYGDATNRWWSNQSDLPRGGCGVSQDAINLYALDRENKQVKVIRIGSNRTEDFILRDCMCIPYAD